MFVIILCTQCRGFLKTDLRKENVLEQGEHVHPADSSKIQIYKAIQNRKQEAEVTSNKSLQLSTKKLKVTQNSLLKHVPKGKSMKRRSRNQRSTDYCTTYELMNFLIDGKLIKLIFYCILFFL